jgi:hypothetical protein
MTGTTTKENILDLAREAITESRQETYGNSTRLANGIAGLWSEYLWLRFGDSGKVSLNPHDVQIMLALSKFGRAAVNPTHWDNYVDAAGYAALAAQAVTDEAGVG